MNKRIKQLAEQAGPNTEEELNDDRTNIYVIDVEKFAELIVKECAEVVKNQYSEDWGKWSNRMILEHFGVEE